MIPVRPFEPQQPCPSCQQPMGGVGWVNAPHDCTTDNPLACPHSEFWIGPWGNCEDCTTEQVLVAALGMNKAIGVLELHGASG